ncbi:hypothetical protein LINPERHAP2_LOCUS33129 [Linum perenne]
MREGHWRKQSQVERHDRFLRDMARHDITNESQKGHDHIILVYRDLNSSTLLCQPPKRCFSSQSPPRCFSSGGISPGGSEARTAMVIWGDGGVDESEAATAMT